MNVSSLSSTGAAPGAGKAAVVGGDEIALREFIAHWMGSIPIGVETVVYVGTLPAGDFDFEVPIPEGARIVGSVIRGPLGAEILVAVSGSDKDTFAFYEQTLATLDWRSIEAFPGASRGFVERPVLSKRFCSDARQTVIMVSVSAVDDMTSAVRLNISRQSNPCQQHFPHRDVFKIMPTLTAPAGVKLHLNRSGMSGSDNSLLSSAVLTTALPLDRLAQAYIDQLDALGWRRVWMEASEHVASSAWVATIENKQWSGHFTLVADPVTAGEYKAWLALYEAGG